MKCEDKMLIHLENRNHFELWKSESFFTLRIFGKNNFNEFVLDGKDIETLILNLGGSYEHHNG